MKTFSCKFGTQPALVQFKHAYRLRPGLRVTYHTIAGGTSPNSSWEMAIVDKIDPLFLTKW